jgi:hypothetical protein
MTLLNKIFSNLAESCPKLDLVKLCNVKAGSLKMNAALEYSTRVVQEGGRRCKESTLDDLVHLTPLRIPLMNPPLISFKLNRAHYSAMLQIYR